MSILATTAGSASSSTPSAASSASTTPTRIGPFPGGVAIFRVLNSIVMFFILLAVNRPPLLDLAFSDSGGSNLNVAAYVSE